MKDFLEKVVLIIEGYKFFEKGGEKIMKKAALAAGILFLFSGIFFTSKTLAYRGNPKVYGPHHTEERHKMIEAAFEKRDYNTWKKLMAGRGIVRKIDTQEKFNKFVEMRKLMLEGKNEEASKIRAELGLGQGAGLKRGQTQK